MLEPVKVANAYTGGEEVFGRTSESETPLWWWLLGLFTAIVTVVVVVLLVQHEKQEIIEGFQIETIDD